MAALRSIAFALAGLVSGGACGLGLTAIIITLFDRAGMIDGGADGLSGAVMFFVVGAATALGGGVVAAALLPGYARKAGAGRALLWVGGMIVVAAACYFILSGPLTDLPAVETLDNVTPAAGG